MVVDGLGQQISDVLLTAGAVDRPNILLSEHAGFLIWPVLLQCDHHIIEIFDLKVNKMGKEPIRMESE